MVDKNNNMEEFKTIPGWEDYQASNLGRIASLKYGKFRVRKQTLNKKTGYLQVVLSFCDNQKMYRVHSLIAMTWNGYIPRKGIHVHHKDDNKLNNKADNLEERTHRDNNSISILKKKKSGLPLGVKQAPSGRFSSRILIDGNREWLGTFDTPKDARDAYKNKLKQLYNG